MCLHLGFRILYTAVFAIGTNNLYHKGCHYNSLSIRKAQKSKCQIYWVGFALTPGPYMFPWDRQSPILDNWKLSLVL